MKRLFVFFSVFIMLLSFSGCRLSKSFTPFAHEYLVSALGFDQKGDEIFVTIESVVINSEDSEAEKKNKLLKGNGKSFQTALKNALGQASQPIELSHCAVAVIGDTLSEKYIAEVCNYIYNEKEITLSIELISTENAEKLLSSETISSVAVGYDIISMRQTYSRLYGINFKNLFYELEGMRQSAVNTFTLPFFKIDEEGYFIDGVTVFKNDESHMKINENKLSVFAIASDSQDAGMVNIGNKQYNLQSVSTVCKLKNENLPKLLLEINISPEFDKNSGDTLENEIINLFQHSQNEEIDIFGVGNIIKQKEIDFFNKYKEKYDEFYKNLMLEVVVK